MIEIRWTQRAARDLRAQQAWLAEQDRSVARRMATEIREAVERMAGPTDLGRPSAYRPCREKSVPRWSKLIIYDRGENHLTVIAVLDTRMNPPEAL